MRLLPLSLSIASARAEFTAAARECARLNPGTGAGPRLKQRRGAYRAAVARMASAWRALDEAERAAS